RSAAYDDPSHWRRRGGHGSQNALLEQLGIGEEQGRIPAEQDQAGYEPRMWVARDVVIAADTVHSAQHGEVRPPSVPEKLDHRDDDRQADSGNGAEHRHADEADDGQPEFPALDAKDATQISQLDQTDGRSHTHTSQRAHMSY